MLLGIKGGIGNGKTTVANYLKNYGFVEYTMANPLKQIALIFGFTEKQVYGTQEDKLEINKDWGIPSREFLQKVGDLFRDTLPEVIPNMKIETSLNNGSVMTKLFKMYYERNKHLNFDIVVSDVRRIDEADLIRELGGKIIEIKRDINRSGAEHNHISETESVKIPADYIIDNNGTLSELYNQIDSILNIKHDERDIYSILLNARYSLMNKNRNYIHKLNNITYSDFSKLYKKLDQFPCKYTYFGETQIRILGTFDKEQSEIEIVFKK